jgi:hypothetical protein
VRCKGEPSFADWLRGAADGRSFVSSGPLLLLEVDGWQPGDRLNKTGPGPHTATARIRLRCEVTPVTHAQLIVNGQVVRTWTIPAGRQQGAWWEVEQRLDLRGSSWIAARAYSTTPGGKSDAEAHTNPLFVYLNGRAPYRRTSLENWLARIEGQIAVHRLRSFAEKPRVLNYFEQARDALLQIREQGGLAANERPADVVKSAAKKAIRQAETTKSIAAPPEFHLDESQAESVGQRNDPAELKRVLAGLATASALRDNPELRRRLLFALGRGLKRAGSRLDSSGAPDKFGPEVTQLLDESRMSAHRVALDHRTPEADRAKAIEQLGCFTLERAHWPLAQSLGAKQPTAVQIAAIRALADFSDPLATTILLRHWKRFTPAVRREVVQALLKFDDRTLAWLQAAERGDLSLAGLTSSEHAALLHHRNQEVAALAKIVLNKATRE